MKEMLRNNKICFVTTIPDFARSFLVHYLKELSKENDVFLLSHFDEIESDREFFKGITLVDIPITRKISLVSDLTVLVKLYLFIRREKFDIVHSGTPKAGLLAMTTARVAEVPLRFHTFTGQVWATKKGILRWVLMNADKVTYHSASDVLVDSNSQRDFLIQEGIIKEERSYVLAKGSVCGVDTNQFKPDPEQRIAIRERLNIPADAFVFFFLGRITEDKGIQELLTAFDRIAGDHPDAYLLLVGPDDERLIHKLNKQRFFEKNKRVIYQGATRTPEIYMPAADVMCLPSHREGFGMVVLEAAAAGIPSIGSRITGVIDAIDDGKTGLIHPKGDVEALRECMHICIADRKRTKRLGHQARLRILRDFSSERLTEEFVKYYKMKLTQARSQSPALPAKEEIRKHLRILYVTGMPMTAMRFIFPLAKRLREMGNIVEFAFGEGDGLKAVEESGFKYTILPMKIKNSLVDDVRIVSQLKRIIMNGHYDVVHTYTPVMGLYGRLAAFGAKAPVVIHSVTGSLTASGVPLYHRIFYFVSEFLTSWMVDFFITLTETDARTIAKYRFASKENVGLLKHEFGISLQKFNPDNIDAAQLQKVRNAHRICEGVPVVGFVGRMIGTKGILDLFEAYKLVRAKGIAAKLAFLGDILSSDTDRESYAVLKDRVKVSGFADDVIFFGWDENTPLYISLMDVVVLPSHYEGFPRIPVEAGAMRKPSICTATSGADVAIEEGKTGLIVPIKDPLAMANAIQKIITDHDLARKMGSAARERIVDLFDENKIVDQQIRIYQEFFKQKRESFALSN